LEFDGDFAQPCQLSGVTGNGVITHRAKQLAVQFVCTVAYVGEESVSSGIDIIESVDRQQVGGLDEHALVAAA
jgi:hypothetical protein